jgi:hypothetical protein
MVQDRGVIFCLPLPAQLFFVLGPIRTHDHIFVHSKITYRSWNGVSSLTSGVQLLLLTHCLTGCPTIICCCQVPSFSHGPGPASPPYVTSGRIQQKMPPPKVPLLLRVHSLPQGCFYRAIAQQRMSLWCCSDSTILAFRCHVTIFKSSSLTYNFVLHSPLKLV